MTCLITQLAKVKPVTTDDLSVEPSHKEPQEVAVSMTILEFRPHA